MLNESLFMLVGEHAFKFTGKEGHILEASLVLPEQRKENLIAILGHPHSLQGGTMQNKVVTTLARTFKELAIPSIRFNFRGVGNSGGAFDQGLGESHDMQALTEQLKKFFPKLEFIFAGFSFGSYVAYRCAAQLSNRLLITIAPPVERFNYLEFPAPSPWIIVQGDSDEVVSGEAVLKHSNTVRQDLAVRLLEFNDTGHFFHGKLIELKDRLIPVITQVLTS
jgi:alpha/beta superfamily hydrolase